jgi:hypothetical protein
LYEYIFRFILTTTNEHLNTPKQKQAIRPQKNFLLKFLLQDIGISGEFLLTVDKKAEKRLENSRRTVGIHVLVHLYKSLKNIHF